MASELLKRIESEFQRCGVDLNVRNTHNGHLALTWQVGPETRPRSYIIPLASSDWRSWRNARAGIRRLFREDGLRQ